MKANVKIIITFCLILGLTVLSLGVGAVTKDSVLVFDPVAHDGVPKKFRSNMGLDVSASGQFSALELQELLRAIPTQPDKIWIIDLRQESHGFVNGLPITWSSDQNSINKHKSPLQIARHEKTLLHDLSKQEKICVYTLKKLQAGKISAVDPVVITPHLVQTEADVVGDYGAKYERFYVLDHNRPDDATVDQYVYFIKETVRPGDWMHFHCRGGKGRSSTFIAMYDMILHAKNASFDDIMHRQEKMGNIQLHVVPTKAEKLWKKDLSEERYAFLQKFYAYVKDPHGYACTSWTEWLGNQASK